MDTNLAGNAPQFSGHLKEHHLGHPSGQAPMKPQVATCKPRIIDRVHLVMLSSKAAARPTS